MKNELITRLASKQIAANYDLVAEQFQADRSTTSSLNFTERFCELLPPSAIVLDIGCGTGIPITKHLVDKKFIVHALDYSYKMISLAKQNVKGAEFFNNDITNWTAPTQYDGIIAWDSIFHLTVENQVNVLKKIIQMLKPGGVGLLTCGVKEGEINSSMFGQPFYYSSPSFKRYIELIKELNCNICFSEIDDPTNGGHTVICFQRKK
jgi:2-polyprenyl-3-methyl-5-hydroxy-6-metoxy-1,4-benzoquinol methylase